MTESVRGQEVLVLDADARVQKGIQQLLSSVGMIVTALGDVAAARKEVGDRFFSVILVDIDTPAPGEGLGFLQDAKQRSPASSLMVLASRRTFDMAVRSFRAGAVDVVIKHPDQVEYLKERVVMAAQRGVEVEITRRLLDDVSQVHEEFLTRMMGASRRIVDLEERISGRGESSNASASDSGASGFTVLVVDGDPTMGQVLEEQLSKEGFFVRWAASGGEALDVAGRGGVHVAVVQQQLPDLPGSMVVSTLKQISSDTIVLSVIPPGEQPGKVKVVETSRNLPLVKQLKDYTQLAARFPELREAYQAKGRERRYLRAFRAQHFDFIKRYVELKQLIAQALGDRSMEARSGKGIKTPKGGR